MDVPLFYVDVLLNDLSYSKALVDSGCSCYALISERLVSKLQVDTIPIRPRPINGVFEDVARTINRVAHMSLDVGGHKQSRIYAYVMPDQHDDMILGKAWLQDQNVILRESSENPHLEFSSTGIRIYGRRSVANETSTIAEDAPRQISGNAFGLWTERAKKSAQVKVFAASMKDIEKALRPKEQLDAAALLPKHYHEFLPVFDIKEASSLPAHRPGIDHQIPLETDPGGNEKAVPWGPLYNMSREELLVLRKTLTELLDKGFIRMSKSSAAAPVLFAKKPGGGLRFCVDYRALNAITKKDRYPLPLIKETLASLSKTKWLTKMDVSAAFHRIRMAKGEEWKTAFRTRYGLYEWMVTPFGLTGAPATFQRYINWCLKEYLDDFCTAYIDDILVFSDGSLEDHREKVRLVLKKLQEAGLQLDIGKCEFEVKSVKYLGYIIDVGRGLRMDPEKVKAIEDWHAPTSVRGVRSFLGFANYYRLFIKDYSRIVLPLTALTKKGAAFSWNSEAEKAFQELKKRFLEDPILASFDPNRETVLETDASGWSTGGVLSQYNDQGELHPVAFFSRKNTPAECNYDIHDKELLAIMKCLEEWDAELRSLEKPFKILTDHRNLEHFMKAKRLTERQMRWALTLARYNFQLSYRPGRNAALPDALSRRDQDMPTDMNDERLEERNKILLPAALWAKVCRLDHVDGPKCSQIEIQRSSPFENEDITALWNVAIYEKNYDTAFHAVENGAPKFPSSLGLHVSISECSIEDGRLLHRGRLWIPEYEPLRTRLIQDVHDSVLSGHPGRDATAAIVGRQFFWPGSSQDVRRFCRNCDICKSTTVWRDKKAALLKPLPVPDRVWREISMDFVEKLPRSSGFENCLVITDRLSKGVILEPVADMSAEGVAKVFLRCFYAHHGLPNAITSDRGVQWVNGFWKKFCELVGIKRRLSTAYHPETDGATERANQELEAYLRIYCTYAQDDWANLLPSAQISISGKTAASTGVSPFFLMHGYELEPIQLKETLTNPDYAERLSTRSPAAKGDLMARRLRDAREYAQTAMAVAQQLQEEQANRRRNPAHHYRVGDKVWLNLKNIKTDRPSKKLDWLHAKYKVTKVIGSHTYELDVPRQVHNRFHTTLLRPASNDPLPSQQQTDQQPPTVIQGDPGESEWAVESILQARWKKIGRGRTRQVLVKWLGYREPTWEPLEAFKDTEALDVFETKFGNLSDNDGKREVSNGRSPRGGRK